MANPQSSAATVEASLVSGQAAANLSAASHNVAVAHDQVGAPAAPPSLSMSALSGPAPSAAASVMAHGTTQPHPHQDCTSAVADGAPAGLHAMQGGNGAGGPRGTGAEGPEIWGSGGAEPGFSSTAPLLTAAADAGHSCTAAPSGSEASQAVKDAEHHTDNPARGPPLEPQASEATVTPAMSGSGPPAADSSGELGSDEDGALPDDASPSASPCSDAPDDAAIQHGAASKVWHHSRDERPHGHRPGSGGGRRHAAYNRHHPSGHRVGGAGRQDGLESHRNSRTAHGEEHRNKRRRTSGTDDWGADDLSMAPQRSLSSNYMAPAHSHGGPHHPRGSQVSANPLSPERGPRGQRWPRPNASPRLGAPRDREPGPGDHAWDISPPGMTPFSAPRGGPFATSPPSHELRGTGRLPRMDAQRARGAGPMAPLRSPGAARQQAIGHLISEPGRAAGMGRRPPGGPLPEDWSSGPPSRRHTGRDPAGFPFPGPQSMRRPLGPWDQPQAWSPQHTESSSHHPPSRFMLSRDDTRPGRPPWGSPPRGRGMRGDRSRPGSPPLRTPSPPRMSRSLPKGELPPGVQRGTPSHSSSRVDRGQKLPSRSPPGKHRQTGAATPARSRRGSPSSHRTSSKRRASRTPSPGGTRSRPRRHHHAADVVSPQKSSQSTPHTTSPTRPKGRPQDDAPPQPTPSHLRPSQQQSEGIISKTSLPGPPPLSRPGSAEGAPQQQQQQQQQQASTSAEKPSLEPIESSTSDEGMGDPAASAQTVPDVPMPPLPLSPASATPQLEVTSVQKQAAHSPGTAGAASGAAIAKDAAPVEPALREAGDAPLPPAASPAPAMPHMASPGAHAHEEAGHPDAEAQATLKSSDAPAELLLAQDAQAVVSAGDQDLVMHDSPEPPSAQGVQAAAPQSTAGQEAGRSSQTTMQQRVEAGRRLAEAVMKRHELQHDQQLLQQPLPQLPGQHQVALDHSISPVPAPAQPAASSNAVGDASHKDPHMVLQVAAHHHSLNATSPDRSSAKALHPSHAGQGSESHPADVAQRHAVHPQQRHQHVQNALDNPDNAATGQTPHGTSSEPPLQLGHAAIRTGAASGWQECQPSGSALQAGVLGHAAHELAESGKQSASQQQQQQQQQGVAAARSASPQKAIADRHSNGPQPVAENQCDSQALEADTAPTSVARQNEQPAGHADGVRDDDIDTAAAASDAAHEQGGAPAMSRAAAGMELDAHQASAKAVNEGRSGQVQPSSRQADVDSMSKHQSRADGAARDPSGGTGAGPDEGIAMRKGASMGWQPVSQPWGEPRPSSPRREDGPRDTRRPPGRWRSPDELPRHSRVPPADWHSPRHPHGFPGGPSLRGHGLLHNRPWGRAPSMDRRGAASGWQRIQPEQPHGDEGYLERAPDRGAGRAPFERLPERLPERASERSTGRHAGPDRTDAVNGEQKGSGNGRQSPMWPPAATSAGPSATRREPQSPCDLRVGSPPAKASLEPLLADMGGVKHSDPCWFYVDPEGQSQGPCSIAHFLEWLRELSRLPALAREYQQFQAVGVWRAGMDLRVPLVAMLSACLQSQPDINPRMPVVHPIDSRTAQLAH